MKKLDLSRLHGRFVKLIEKYQTTHDVTQQDLAKMVGIQKTHFNAILRKAPNRPLTGYYILRFIGAGIFSMDDIYDGKAKSEAELEFWEMAKVAGNHALIARIVRLQKQGINVEALLDAVDPQAKK